MSKFNYEHEKTVMERKETLKMNDLLTKTKKPKYKSSKIYNRC